MPTKAALPPEAGKVVKILFRDITRSIKDLKKVLDPPASQQGRDSDSDEDGVRRRLHGKQKPPSSLKKESERAGSGTDSKPEPKRTRITKKSPPKAG